MSWTRGSHILLLLFAGCFTQTSITTEEEAPDNRKVYFHLRDGSCIRSYADHHRRVHGGYEVEGTVFRNGERPRGFDGLIPDHDIDRFGIDTFSVAGSVVGVGIGALAVAFVSFGLCYR